ncbi:ribosomal RNA processing protein 36 homolog isoform X2 [Patella vulgata]|nr:ribosomal RNA processing protein 36 homolog isoform X2 [Patella vulgata]XP_050407452.1 ribosomal RNA processing protein 36 homolog isoform X2 [Patella vulgata]
MEPCSDSSGDDDLQKFQQKFKKQTKGIKLNPTEESADDSDNISSGNIKHKNSSLHKHSKSSDKSKHKRFDKGGDAVSDDDDDDDDDDGEDDDDQANPVKSVLDESESEAGESDDEGVDPYATIRKELIDMSFEDKQKLRNKLGAKIYNQIVHSERKNQSKPGHSKNRDREYKDRPVEISAKKRVPVFRKVVQVKRKLNRDPRFDDLSGEFDEKKFKHTYAFLDEMKKKEKKKIVTAMKKEKDKTRKSELKSLANRYKQYEEADERKSKKNSLLNKWKERERELVKDGKTPYFLKQSDVKKLELAEKYKELKEKGGLDKYLAKRRKKNANRERKKLHI